MMTLDDIVEHYRAFGYVVVPGLLSPAEIAELRAVTDSVAATAAGQSEETPVFDFDPATNGAPITIQRIKKPHRVHTAYARLSGHPALLAVLERIIGSDIRLSHSKINMKAGNGGAALEWHQDWAYAPHTNMDTCVISIMIDDASVANGAMQVISESHKGPLHEHHDQDGYFDGAIDVAAARIDMNRAVPLEGCAGTVTFHHPLTIHGSGVNRSGDPRRILFLEYAAADAFPLFYSVDWPEYQSRMVAGRASSEVRIVPNVVKLPFPSRAGSSIYKIQANSRIKYFAEAN
jgi:ectoine hydroxylase-related dioxygenase (phytanoyl-CoA dioxygenase family)